MMTAYKLYLHSPEISGQFRIVLLDLGTHTDSVTAQDFPEILNKIIQIHYNSIN